MSVPTCKYFARGTCRYGDRCRFYHPPGGVGGGGGQQGYYAGQGQGDASRVGGVYNQMQESRLKLNENVRAIEEMVKKDMVEWEKGKIWPFSCYGPTGGRPNLEGFEDISFEELRYATMQNNGVVPNNIPMRVQLWNRARAKWQQTTQENLNAIEQLILGSVSQQQSQSSGAFGASQTPFSGGSFAATGSTFNQGLGSQKPSGTLGNFSFCLNNAQKQNQSAMEAGPGSQMGALSSFSFNQAISQTQPAMNQGLTSAPMQQLSMGQQGFASNTQPQQPNLNQGFPMVTQQPQQQQTMLAQGFPNVQTQQQPQGFPSAPQAQPGLNLGFGSGMQPQQPTPTPGFFSSAPTQPQTSANPLSSFSFNMNQQAPTSGMSSGFPQGSAFTAGSTQPSFFGTSQSAPNQAPFGQSAFGSSTGPGTAVSEAYENNVYSKLSDLTPSEIQAFEAPRFEVDTLPLHAPAKKFCF